MNTTKFCIRHIKLSEAVFVLDSFFYDIKEMGPYHHFKTNCLRDLS